MTRRGRIIEGVGSFYTVQADGQESVCRARGLFRDKDLVPTVGDWVEFDPPEPEREGYILDILPRDSLLRRPPVSNVDLLALVVTVCQPQPDLLLTDRLLVDAGRMGVKALLCINKTDLAAPQEADALACQYSSWPVCRVSALTGEGVVDLAERMADRTVCMAGQSGTGKTSLINRLVPGAEQTVGQVGLRSRRGAHTTRRSRLLALPQGGWVVDTPGFSLLETERMEPAELPALYPEFRPYEGACRFQNCLHGGEPGCAVARAVELGDINPQRYGRYRRLLEEVREQWNSRYR